MPDKLERKGQYINPIQNHKTRRGFSVHPSKIGVEKAAIWKMQNFTDEDIAKAFELDLDVYLDLYEDLVHQKVMLKYFENYKIVEKHAKGAPGTRKDSTIIRKEITPSAAAAMKLGLPNERSTVEHKVKHEGKVEHQHFHAMQRLKPLDADEWQKISRSNNKVTKQDLLTVLGENEIEEAEIEG